MVLVTGATGTVGSVVIRGLLEFGVPACAAVTDPARAQPTLPAGARPVRFDFTDPTTFGAALEGVQRVFLMRPPAMGDPKAFLPLLERMARAG